MRVTPLDLDKLLNETYYDWNTTSLLSGVVDFLGFSEQNLGWLRRREIQRAEDEATEADFEPPDDDLAETYRRHLVESAEYRFDVGLAQSIRYSGLTAFITAMELCAKAFTKRITWQLPDKPKEENKYVHVLSVLNQRTCSGFEEQLTQLRHLFHVRHCLVHAAGFLEGYDNASRVREAAGRLEGIIIWEEDFLGVSVCVKQGAVERYARAAIEWVPALNKKCTEAGLMK